MAASGRV